MALSKVNNTSKVKVDQLITAEDSEDISMGINQAAMRLIIDRLTDLYPNPISATVRETISNGFDATMRLDEADRKPIEVTSPSSFSPVFVVKDHGIGMSVDDIRNIYSQYGGSTKRDDFTQIGAYGLGAKAPLAYCSEFSVVTTRDGVTTDFIVSRKAEGNVTTIISTEVTGDTSGTTVSVPVKHGDFRGFDGALSSYRTLSVDIPVVVDGVPTDSSDYILFDTFCLDEESDTWGRVWTPRTPTTALAELFRGRVIHPTISYLMSGWLYHNRYYGSPDFIIELKPGVVDFTSSRDEITVNDRSKDLMARISGHYRTGSASHLQTHLMEYFRKLTPSDAWALMNRVSFKLNDDGRVKISTHNDLYDVSEFTTDSGFNLIESIIEGRQNRNLFGLVTLHPTKAAEYTFVKPRSIEDLSYELNCAINGKVSEVSEAILNSVDDGPGTSFVEVMRFVSIKRFPQLVVIHGVDSDFAKLFTRSRKLIASKIFPLKFIFLADGPVTPDDLKVIESFGVAAPELHSAAEVTALIAKERAAAAKLRKVGKAETEVRLTKLTTGFKNFQEYDQESERRWYSNSHGERVLLSSVIASNALVLISSAGNARFILNSLANDNIDILNTPIYCAVPSDLRAEHFRMLHDYEHVYWSQSADSHLKIAQKIAETKTRGASFRVGKFAELAIEDAVGLVLGAKNIHSRGVFARLAKLTTNESLRKVFTLFADSTSVTNYSVQHNPSLLLKDRLAADVFDALNGVLDKYSEVNSSTDLDNRIYSEVLNNVGTETDTEMTELILRKLARVFEAAVEVNADNVDL
jgi:hypothetical protein